MKVEAILKRVPSCKAEGIKSRSSSLPFPGVWGLQCFSYDSLKCHIREYSAIRKQQGECEEITEDSKWKHSFKVRLDTEITKINTFYDERHHECEDGLKAIASEIPFVCTIKAPGSTHMWHDFISVYSGKSKLLQSREFSPSQFIDFLEGHLLLMAEKSIDPAILSILKRLVLIHKQSLQLKSFAQFNITGLKKILRKHDERTEYNISTEWMDRIQHESFYIHDPFEKTVTLTKDIIRSLTPSLDDFSCAICLGLLCEPVIVPCGHAFCQHCLEVISASCNFCPMCRTEMQLNNRIPDKQLKTYLKQYFPLEYKATQKDHKASKRKTTCIIS